MSSSYIELIIFPPKCGIFKELKLAICTKLKMLVKQFMTSKYILLSFSFNKYKHLAVSSSFFGYNSLFKVAMPTLLKANESKEYSLLAEKVNKEVSNS